MKKIAYKRAFTILELLVAMSIFAILGIGISNIDFNRLGNTQKLDIFTNDIISQIELVRNNALLGKGESTSLVVPDKWQITFGLTDGGEVKTSYFISGSETQLLQEDINGENTPDGFKMNAISCTDLNETSSDSIIGNETGILTLQGSILTLGGDCDSGQRGKIIITTAYKGLSKKISINTVNGLIETSK